MVTASARATAEEEEEEEEEEAEGKARASLGLAQKFPPSFGPHQSTPAISPGPWALRAHHPGGNLWRPRPLLVTVVAATATAMEAVVATAVRNF